MVFKAVLLLPMPSTIQHELHVYINDSIGYNYTNLEPYQCYDTHSTVYCKYEVTYGAELPSGPFLVFQTQYIV